MSYRIIRDNIQKLHLDIAEIQKEDLLNLTLTYITQYKTLFKGRDKFGENIRPIVCLFLAGKNLGINLDVKSMSSLSCKTEKDFEIALKHYTKILNLQPKVEFLNLSLKFNSPKLNKTCLNLYKIINENLDKDKRGSNGIKGMDDNLIKLGTFYVVAKKNGIRINREQISKEYICFKNEFKFIIKYVEELMVKLDVESKEKILDETLIQNKEDSAIKKKTKKMASPFLGYSMIHPQPYNKTREFKRYLDWKAQLLQKINSKA